MSKFPINTSVRTKRRWGRDNKRALLYGRVVHHTPAGKVEIFNSGGFYRFDENDLEVWPDRLEPSSVILTSELEGWALVEKGVIFEGNATLHYLVHSCGDTNVIESTNITLLQLLNDIVFYHEC